MLQFAKFYLTCLFLISGCSLHAQPSPNILFITVDDLNTDLGAYGHPIVRSPNIDALAERGIRFDAAYAQYPVCSPSRVSFMTGLYPSQTGVVTNGVDFRAIIPNVVTLPEHLRNHGYTTARVGKIYHYNVPADIGSNGQDDPRSWDAVSNPKGVDVDYGPDVNRIAEGPIGATLTWLNVDAPSEQHTDSLVTDSAIDYLDKFDPGKTGKPFFIGVGYFRPHTPFIAPSEFFDLYPIETISAPDPIGDDREDIPVAALADRPGQLEMSSDIKREVIQAYYASISFVDGQIGRLLLALEERGLKDDTIIVLMSDHGFQLGDHGLWQKGDLFEGSARAPLIISTRDTRAAPMVVTSPIEFVDLFPTLVDLAGLPIPEHVSGLSFKSVLSDGPESGPRTEAYTMAASRAGKTRDEFKFRTIWGHSIRTEKYRYTEWEGGLYGVELYHYEEGQGELANLAEKEGEYANIRAVLSRRLEARIADASIPFANP